MQEDKDACFEAGCNGFLTKPIDVRLLNDAVEKYLDIKRSESSQTTSLISSLLEEDPGAIDLIKRFVNNFAEFIKNIEQSIQKYDWDNLSDILHQLKGTGGNFGYPAISELAEEMELYTIKQNETELNRLLSKLKSVYKEVELGLK